MISGVNSIVDLAAALAYNVLINDRDNDLIAWDIGRLDSGRSSDGGDRGKFLQSTT